MSDLTGVALVISAVLGPMAMMFTAWLNARNSNMVKAVAEETLNVSNLTLEKATSTDHAVNGRDPRMSTLSEDVITIRDKQEIDVPTVVDTSAETVRNGNAVLPMLTYLTTAMEELKEDMAALKSKEEPT